MNIWKKRSKYYLYLLKAQLASIVEFPKGYCCSSCEVAFSNYQARNLHTWKEHPGCAKYRKETFWDWLFDSEEENGKMHGIYHSCKCQPYHEQKCGECDRTTGVYR